LKPASAPPRTYGHRCQFAEGTSPRGFTTKFLNLVCDENGIGGSGEYCGDNDAQLCRINIFYHEALGGKYVPCVELFDLEPGKIGTVTLSRRSANTSA
jgi:tubulin beta